MGCCGDDAEDTKEGLVIKRSCRDVLCLLFFVAFWVGMFIICGIAFQGGEPNRLVYGVDSYGMTCGAVNDQFNKSVDLRNNKNLYWLNPLDLLSADGILYAKSICAPGCPVQQQLCSKKDFPCTRGEQYRCPYYRFAEDQLYGKIPDLTDENTTYYDDLLRVTNITDGSAAHFIQKVKSLGGAFTSIAARLESNLSGEYYQLMSQFPGNGPCYPVLVETKEFFHRCMPNFPANMTAGLVSKTLDVFSSVNSGAIKTFSDKWSSSGAKWGRYVGDISRGILVIVIGGLCGGLVLSMFWLGILRFLGGFMVWIAIIFVNISCIAACLFTWVKAGYIGNSAVGQDILDALPLEINPAEDEKRTWFWIAIGSSITAGIVLLVTLLCISRIKIAVACIKVASQAVASMPSIIFFPILPFIFMVGLVIYWVAVTALLYSSGDLVANCRTPASAETFTWSDLRNVSNVVKSASDYSPADSVMAGFGSSTNVTAAVQSCYVNQTEEQRSYLCGRDPNCYISYDWNNKLKYAFIYHFFGLLWTSQVLVGFSCVTIAGAIAHFYWARGDSEHMPTFPVLTALKNTVVYHMGSICFAAFIIAVIQLIRALLEYLDRKTKELQAQNKFAEWAMCIVKCCMWCIEQIVKFINRNAYIMMAIKGKGYCSSAMDAIKLIVSNALRVSVVNLVATVLIFLGKVSVAATAGVIAYAMTTSKYYNSPAQYPETYLYSPVLVIAVSVIVAYMIAQIFFAVYEISIDTIILAFCEDCDRNDGNPKYAPALLMEVMGGAKGGGKDDATKVERA